MGATMDRKLCKVCRVELVLGENFTDGQKKARNYRCRKCASDNGKLWSKQNRARARETAKARAKSNPEAVKAYRAEYYSRNKDKWAEYHKNWRKVRRGDPERRAKSMCSWTRVRARAMGLDFDLTPEFLAEKMIAGSCEATGIPFDLTDGVQGKKKVHHYAPSIDRIDPSRGYTMSNVRLVVYIYNLVKSEYSDATVLEFARQVLASAERASTTS